MVRIVNRSKAGRTATLLLLAAVSAIMLFPLLWMVSTSLKADYQIFVFPPRLIPSPVKWDNYVHLFETYPVGRYLWNTVYVTALTIAGKVVSCTVVAYGFARFKAPGKEFLFAVLLATMMIPWAVTMVPLFILFKSIGWYDTYLPLWVPSFFGDAFYIFLLRQFMLTIPRELEEAGKMDGAGSFRTLSTIVLPMVKPAVTVVAIFTFFNAWNDFLGPVIFLGDSDKATLQLAIQNMATQFDAPWNYMMGMSLISILPCLAVFFAAQRQMVEGIALTGVKG